MKRLQSLSFRANRTRTKTLNVLTTRCSVRIGFRWLASRLRERNFCFCSAINDDRAFGRNFSSCAGLRKRFAASADRQFVSRLGRLDAAEGFQEAQPTSIEGRAFDRIHSRFGSISDLNRSHPINLNETPHSIVKNSFWLIIFIRISRSALY